MCGIAGSISWEVGHFNLSDAIKHRGPDDYGFFSEGPIQFEHRRLSIIDTSSRGHQPMHSKDGNLTIIYNGEIYNYKSLKSELVALGYTFESECDTEVLLYGYAEFGKDYLSKLNGIFAFAIYDKRRQEVVIARDQFGIKPLYYYFKEGLFMFGSEIKSFLSHPQFDKTVNYSAIFNYIQFLYCPGEITPFQHVKRLGAGNHLTISVKAGSSIMCGEPVKYFTIPFTGQYEYRSENEWKELLEHQLVNAVSSQLLSDVPIGFFLSGGLDSSLIVSLASKVTSSPLCFTIDTGDQMAKEGFADDLHYAKKVASHTGANLVVLESKADILKDFDRMIWHLDEPQADPAAIHVFNICKGAREQGIKVLLSGAGGDDLFTGYRRHQALEYEKYIQLMPQFIRKGASALFQTLKLRNPAIRRIKKFSRELALTPQERMINYFTWLPSETTIGLFNSDILQSIHLDSISTSYYKDVLNEIPKEKNPVNKMLHLELRTFLSNHNLNYTDKLSMAAGVEARVPYLDIDLVNLSTRIPPDLKMKDGTTKYILKKTAEKYLPKDVIYRPKTGFGAPVRDWVRKDLSEMIGDRLSEETLRKRGFLSPQAVQNLLKSNQSNQEDYAYPIIAILAVESWLEQFTD